MFLLYIFIFLICCVLLYFSGDWVVGGLMRTARFLGWREFVVAFFVMAFAASLPNLFVGVISAINKIPQLAFGDVAGNNLIALTLAIALGVLFSKNKEITAESQTVQTTSIFTIIAAILPLGLIFDGTLSRIDGILLIAFFVFYILWLFSKKERFTKIYNTHQISIVKDFKNFFRDLGKLILGIILLLLSAQGIVSSAQFFAQSFDIPIILIGLLVTGVGSALPEIYFAIFSARRGEDWMILGDLMGAVIFPATLVLGIVSLICPIRVFDFSSLAIARIFLIISAVFFLIIVRTDRKITKKEAIILIVIYFLFLSAVIFFRS